MPLAQVAPGMVGEAYTVFQGTQPEAFKVRVISILRNFLPKQDIILVRAEDPRVAITGIASGMSGSPVYIDHKLVGAIAYGWSFAKEPLAGVTPIESMLAEKGRTGRPPPDPYQAQSLDPTPGPSRDEFGAHVQPVAIPLSVSGTTEAAFAYFSEELRSFGLHPVRAGGAGERPGPGRVAVPPMIPGAALGAALIRGDMSITAMGTLTHTDGKQVVAFGHPMFGIGAVNLPMVLGEIHAIIPSLASSVKMASPIAEIGSITDDTKNGIVGLIGGHASTVPIQVRVVSRGARKLPFSVEVARHRRLMPLLAVMAVSTALSDAIPDVTDMMADVTTRLHVRGFDPIELRDQIHANEALAPRILAMSHGMRALSDLLGNPFAPAIVEKIDIGVSVDFRADIAEIVGLAAPGEDVTAATTLPLRVTLRPYAGAEFVETLTIDVPRELAGRTMKIEVAGGAQVKPDLPRAENLRDFIENLRTYYAASTMVVSVVTKEDGASLRGQLIHNLPPSALDSLRGVHQTRRADIFQVVERTVFPRSRVISGHQTITVQVIDRKGPKGPESAAP